MTLTDGTSAPSSFVNSRVFAVLAALFLVGATVYASSRVQTGPGDAAVVLPDEESEDLSDSSSADPTAQLRIGFLSHETGQLASQSRIRLAAAEAAATAVNDAGGVFGSDIRIVAVQDNDLQSGAEKLLGEDVDAIVVSVASSDTLELLTPITERGVILFSPVNTSPILAERQDRNLFFRNAPSDILQGQLLADEIAADGPDDLAIIYRDDAYGSPLANAIRTNFELSGRKVTTIVRFDAPSTTSGPLRIDELSAISERVPDAIAVVGFAEESAEIVEELHRQGLWDGTSGPSLWGVDGNAGIENEIRNPALLNEMRQILPTYDLNKVKDDDVPFDTDVSFTARTYDAIVTLALAATAAGTDNRRLIADRIVDQTRGEFSCESFAECLELLDDGKDIDIDYEGFSGDYDLDYDGEACSSLYRVDTYGTDGPEPPSPHDYVLGELSIVNELNRLSIQFTSGGSELRDDQLFNLRTIADLLAQSDELIEIQGYADQVGSAELSQQLSTERARAVRSYLELDADAAAAIDGAVGYGQTSAFGAPDGSNRVVRFEQVGGRPAC